MENNIPESVADDISQEELLDLYATASLKRVMADTNTQEQQWDHIYHRCRDILRERMKPVAAKPANFEKRIETISKRLEQVRAEVFLMGRGMDRMDGAEWVLKRLGDNNSITANQTTKAIKYGEY